MKIAFLLDNAYGIGGTIRATVNLSAAFADHHRVEVVSLRRSRGRPALPFDPRVTLTPLIDVRRDSRTYDGDDPLFHRPSHRFTEGADHLRRGIATRLGDLRIEEYLRGSDADVVIATRPKLNDYLAAYGRDRYLRIGQEHLTHAMHKPRVNAHQDAALPHLDAFVTVSHADAAQFRAALPGTGGPLIRCIPNAVPAPDVEPSDGESRLIVAAGRLIPVKRYDRLLKAFALVSEQHPDWRLRLYGRGRRQAALRTVIDRLGLYDRAYLMGARAPLETEWAKGAIAAVSSDAESFGMTLVEAMHCGVPVVSTDCPYGPGEIITDGTDGLLSPLGRPEDTAVRAHAEALLRLIESPELRHRMARAALARAARYAPERIAAEYEQLIEALPARRSGPAPCAVSRPVPRSVPRAVPPPVRLPPHRSAVAPVQAASSPYRPLGRTVRRTVRPLLRPVLRWLRGQEPGPGPRAGTGGRPGARVRVTADGSLAVRLRTARLPDGAAALVLRARRWPGTEPVRVPLPAHGAAADGWTEVLVDRAEHRLPEGRWDVYLERAASRRSAGRSTRVHAELIETARLLSGPVVSADGCVARWLPYTTSGGFLAVRAWHRTGHAEVTAVELERRCARVHLELYGRVRRAVTECGATVVARPRGGGQSGTLGFEVPLQPLQSRRPLGPGSGPDRDGNDAGAVATAFELPYDLPAACGAATPGRQPMWDLWLRPTGEAPGTAVPLGRLLDDLDDRTQCQVLPPVALGERADGVWLHFTPDSGLAVALEPLPGTRRAVQAELGRVTAASAGHQRHLSG